MNPQYDFIIVGGGVVGCMLARFLSRYQGSILLIEKEPDVGMGASSANSAIVHAGYDPIPGTLKAKLNVRANPLWDNLAGELSKAKSGRYYIGCYLQKAMETESMWGRFVAFKEG